MFKFVLAQGISNTKPHLSMNVYSIFTDLYVHINLYLKM